jgi:hypothetical protein
VFERAGDDCDPLIRVFDPTTLSSGRVDRTRLVFPECPGNVSGV